MLWRILILGVILLSIFELLSGCKQQQAHGFTDARVVLIGDSITDGGTYQVLIGQALKEAGQPAPVLINAGIGGDIARGVCARLERDVLAYQPTLVTLSIGINDTMTNVPMAAYQADVLAIVEQLQGEKIPLVLFTLTPLGPQHAAKEESWGAKNAFLRETARQRGLTIVEIDTAMRRAMADGVKVLEADGIHITYDGYRVITRAILDAFGFPQVKLPETFAPAVLPGLVTEWQILALKEDQAKPLTDATAQAVRPDAGWVKLTLPHPTPQADWWPDQERKRGIANDLAKMVGPGKAYLGYTVVKAEKAAPVYFHTGGYIQAIWLNNQCIFRAGGASTGWHPGKERIPAQLQAGDNIVIIECRSAFSLQVTGERFW